MEWDDQGIVLSTRRHGENAVILSAFTHSYGRHLGFVAGGAGRKARGALQTGNLLSLGWKSRLPEQLGRFAFEPDRSFGSRHIDDAGRLKLLAAMAGMADAVLPEREPYPLSFKALLSFLERLDEEGWMERYVLWELELLADLGFGLALDRCVATGKTENLVFVSPKSGGAVCEEAGRPWRDRLLPLPAFLLNGKRAEPPEILAGLRLTGYFLERCVLHPDNRKMPPARMRLEADWTVGRETEKEEMG